MPLSPELKAIDRDLLARNNADRERIHGRRSGVGKCCDCGNPGQCTTPVDGGRTYCDACWTWRARHGYQFDPRAIQVLAKEVA